MTKTRFTFSQAIVLYAFLYMKEEESLEKDNHLDDTKSVKILCKRLQKLIKCHQNQQVTVCSMETLLAINLITASPSKPHPHNEASK